MVRIADTTATQKVVLTCTELTSLVNPFYLWVLTHSITKEVKTGVFICRSLQKSRFNLFEVDRGFFPSVGWYDLKVYEQLSEDNIDPLQSGGLVEETRLFVEYQSGDVYQENQIFNNSISNFKEYDGQ